MDDLDRAKEREMEHRRLALQAHRQRVEAEQAALPDPLVIDGRVCCLDCREPIPEQRLRIRPEARRCVPCKRQREQRHD